MIFPAILCSLIALQTPSAPSGPAASAPAPAPRVVHGTGSPAFAIPRLEDTVAIDVDLSEPSWQRAARLSGFSETLPVDGQQAREQT